MDDGSNPHRIFVERTLAIIKPDAVHKSEEIEDVIFRSGFTVLQHKPENPCVWLAEWLMKNCPNNPEVCDGDTVKDTKHQNKNEHRSSDKVVSS
uniref:NME/NM23 family member 5 n=1 Tax=Cynoglossus semilaevis TaxID=244447 RepID=A0A3P8VUV6_CYNSE